MTARLSVVATAVVAAIVALPAQEPPRQTFRSGTDVVMADVTVRADGRNVAGLTTRDFQLTDNGVPQQIESVEATAVPIDVTVVVDVSGSPLRPYLDRRPDPAKVAAELEREVAAVAGILRSTDRIRLLTIDRYVRQVFPLLPKDKRPPVRLVEFDGLASINDGLAAALLQPVEPARRHVVVARTKGGDAMSALAPIQVRAIASRSDALFHIVLMETALDNDHVFKDFQCNTRLGMGLCWPVNRFWVPPVRRMISPGPFFTILPPGLIIKEGAEMTGGGWHQAVGLSTPSLVGTFRETFDNFRSSYILRYTPQGVPRAGWHTIEVTMPEARARGYTVSARKGYGVDEIVPKPKPTPVPAYAPFETLADFSGAYARASYQQFMLNLRQVKEPAGLLDDFESGGIHWPGAPRREASFALELAEPAWYSATDATRAKARKVLERVTRLLRQPLDPDDFEREWYFAALAMMQGAIRPADTQGFIDRAIDRFPADGRFRLMRAINTEQMSLADSRVSKLAAAGAPKQASVELAQKHYEEAMGFPAVAVEARLRLAWILQRAGKSPEALELLTRSGGGAASDPPVRYLHYLFLGHVLVSSNKLDDAVAAFRAATQVGPGAQAARVALMNALALRGGRTESQTLSEQIQADRSQTTMDPWWMYWQGYYRAYPQALGRLREMSR
jgi:tetratricopeptide (TPR) repeat protein